MEVEDPITDKFRALIETLMAKTTSEVVKVFSEVLLETRLEISRSWKEIDELKQKLEESEVQRAEAVLRSETVSFKREMEEVVVSHVRPQFEVSDVSTVCTEDSGSKGEVHIAKVTTGEKTGSVIVHEPVTSRTTLDTSDVDQSENSLECSQRTQVSQTAVKRKRGRPVKSSRAAGLQKCMKQTEVISKSKLQAFSVVDPQQPSSSNGIIILGKNRCKKGAVVTRKKYIQKNVAPTGSVGATHTLRDRQFLGNQRSCSCCSSTQCSQQDKQLKAAVSQVYTCSKCGRTFHGRMQFKSHKCSSMHECNRCGQTFKNLKNLATHRRSIHPSSKPFRYCCYLCGHRFTTRCGWNLHKRIHTHSNLAENAQETKPSQLLTLPKELKAKVEVRLERISDAQLEAALCPKDALLQGENSNPSCMTIVPTMSSEGTIMNTPVASKKSGNQNTSNIVLKQSEKKTRDSVIPTASGQIQQTKEIFAKLWPTPSAASEQCEEGSSGGSNGLRKGLNSLSRKRKMLDCSHDVYNGMFPVEKILRWRNTKRCKMEKHVGAS